MKKCNICLEQKELSDFSKDSSKKDGYRKECKACKNAKAKIYRRSKDGLVQKLYGHQIQSSKHRGYELPKYNLKELKDWCFNNKEFNDLYYKWINSNFNKNKTPSIDRLNDYLSYDFNNIQILTWEENNNKARLDIKNGVNNKNSKAVIQFDLEMNKIEEFHSQKEAERITGINNSLISSCVNGKVKHAGGFMWKRKELNDGEI